MQQHNIAAAFAEHFTAFALDAKDESNAKLHFNFGDLSGCTSRELQTLWGLLPGHSLIISMKSPTKFSASLSSPDCERNTCFALKTQLEVMLENLVTPEEGEKVILQAIWEMLVDMGFDEEVSRLATIEAENNLERAIELAIPISTKIRAEKLMAQHAHQNLELALRKYLEVRLENLTSFCLLCDNVVENPNPNKSCVCSRSLCDWQFKQVGLVPTSSLKTPRLVRGLKSADGIVSLAAGDHHSVACFQNGKVFSWGKGTAGQLGDGLLSTSAVPVEATSEKKFTKVAAGCNFTLALSHDGGLYVWGAGQSELGLGQDEETLVPEPTQIRVINQFKYQEVFRDISVAGRLCFAISSANEIYSWGQKGEFFQNAPTLVEGIAVKSVTAHPEISACVDIAGRIRIWDRSKRTFSLATVKQRSYVEQQAKDYTRVVVFERRLLASVSDSQSVFEYSMERDNGGWILTQQCEHFGVQNYTAGPTYAVLAQNGVVRVAGTGSEVMCRSGEVTSTNGVEIPRIQFAELIAAGPNHVVCVSRSDWLSDHDRNMVLFQWGRDHSIEAAIECQSDVRAANELKWAKLVDQAKAASDWGIQSGSQQLDLLPDRRGPEYDLEIDGDDESWKEQLTVDVPNEGHEYATEELNAWNDDVHKKVLSYLDHLEADLREDDHNDEKNERAQALSVLDKCCEMRDELQVELKLDPPQLVIDLNHPALLLGKVLDENSPLQNVNIDVNAKDLNGNTALMLAMKRNDYDLVSKLVDLGSDLNALNDASESPLDIAVSCGTSYAKSFVVLLVEQGATMCSSANHDEILDIIGAAAEYFPKLANKLEGLVIKYI